MACVGSGSNIWIHSLLAIYTTTLPIYTNSINEDPVVRLVNGTVPSEGRLEVFFNNTWGTVCDDYFYNTEGAVVCRQLNYIGLVSVAPRFGSGEGPIWLDDVDCNGSEDSIFDCDHRAIGVHTCQHSEDVGIRCDPSGHAEEGAVRLAGGNNHSTGRVEIFHSGAWVNVCDRGWDISDATVVCRQLGFKRALSAPIGSQYGSGVGDMWLLNVQCSGSESRLTECDHDGWGTSSLATLCYPTISSASVECEGSIAVTISPTKSPLLITSTDLIHLSTIAPSHSMLPSKSISVNVLRLNYTLQLVLPTHSNPLTNPTSSDSALSPPSIEFILGLVILLMLCFAVLLIIIILVCVYRNRGSKSVRVEDLQQVFPATVHGLEDQSVVILTNASIQQMSHK